MSDVSRGMPRPTLILLGFLTLFWGFNWPMMKLVLTEMTPLHFRSWCLGIGALGLFAVARFAGLPMRVPPGSWGRLILIALFNVGAWNVLAMYGIPLMDSGRAAILGYTFPIWGVLLSVWVLKEPFTLGRFLGLVIGMTGMALLLGSEVLAVGRSPLGALLMLGAALTWAMGIVMMRRWPVELPTTSFSAWQLTIAFVPIYLGALLVEPGEFSPLGLSTGPLLGFLYNIFLSSIFCYWAWIKIATTTPVGISSLSTLMIPVVGVFSGVLVLGERPQWSDYAALVLVVTALAIVLIPGRPADLEQAKA